MKKTSLVCFLIVIFMGMSFPLQSTSDYGDLAENYKKYSGAKLIRLIARIERSINKLPDIKLFQEENGLKAYISNNNDKEIIVQIVNDQGHIYYKSLIGASQKEWNLNIDFLCLGEMYQIRFICLDIGYWYGFF